MTKIQFHKHIIYHTYDSCWKDDNTNLDDDDANIIRCIIMFRILCIFRSDNTIIWLLWWLIVAAFIFNSCVCLFLLCRILVVERSAKCVKNEEKKMYKFAGLTGTANRIDGRFSEFEAILHNY
jgi:hypothetical protein